MNISHALLQAIATTGIQPDELAARMKLAPSIVNQLCRGSRNASEEQVRQIAAALDCEVRITVQFLKKEPVRRPQGYRLGR